MSKHRSQVQHSPALVLAYPVHGHNALRPSGRPDDPPEIEADGYYSPMTPEEQCDWDASMRVRDPSYFKANQPHWAYWDRVRKLKAMSPRARKRAEEREAKRRSS